MKKTLAAISIVVLAGTSASAQILYSNGPLSTGPVSNSGTAAPAGFEWSECQNDVGNLTESNTTAGYSGHISGTTGAFRLADDFVIPVGQTWDISGFCTYGYQTGTAAGAQPISGGSFNVWSSRPGDGGEVLLATATFDALTDTNMYRIFNSAVPAPGTPPGTTRLIRQIDWNVTGGSVTLGAGTYWVDFQYTLATGTSIFVPPVTVPGSRGLPGWNGRQLVTTGWVDALDAGNPATAPDVPQDLPFIVKGIPAPGSLALLGLGGLIAARRRRA